MFHNQLEPYAGKLARTVLRGEGPSNGPDLPDKAKVNTIRELTREAGRDPDDLQMSAFVDPKDGGLSADELAAFRDAGASRIVLFSQPFAKEIAEGNPLGCIDRVAPIVERAQAV